MKKSKKQIDKDDHAKMKAKGMASVRVRVPAYRKKEIHGIASIMRAEHLEKLKGKVNDDC